MNMSVVNIIKKYMNFINENRNWKQMFLIG